MSRSYLLFGSDDGKYWEQIGEVNVGGAQQALNEARKTEAYRHYATCTVRNWAAMTPEPEERDPIIRWKPMVPGQLSVDDALNETPAPSRHDLGSGLGKSLDEDDGA